MKKNGGVIDMKKFPIRFASVVKNRGDATPESKILTPEGTSASSFPFNSIVRFREQVLLGQISNYAGMPEE